MVRLVKLETEEGGSQQSVKPSRLTHNKRCLLECFLADVEIQPVQTGGNGAPRLNLHWTPPAPSAHRDGDENLLKLPPTFKSGVCRVLRSSAQPRLLGLNTRGRQRTSVAIKPQEEGSFKPLQQECLILTLKVSAARRADAAQRQRAEPFESGGKPTRNRPVSGHHVCAEA